MNLKQLAIQVRQRQNPHDRIRDAYDVLQAAGHDGSLHDGCNVCLAADILDPDHIGTLRWKY